MHLLVALTPHGYGHAAMTAPVVAELVRRYSCLRVTLQTSVEPAWLAGRYPFAYDLVGEIPDFGLAMTSATGVDVAKSRDWYREMQILWPDRVARETDRLRDLKPDLILANIPPVTLAAARRAGIPAMALSCLNWAELYRHYCGHFPEAPAIHRLLLDAYAGAEVFLRAEPAMPMGDLPNIRDIGPLARVGRKRPFPWREKTAAIALGGIATALDFSLWPRHAGWRFCVDPAWLPPGRDDFCGYSESGMEIGDLIASADLLILKPGYGMFAEAGCIGAAVLYLERPDWPETPYLAAWLIKYANCREISADRFLRGDIAADMAEVLISPKPKPALPLGIDQAVELIGRRLEQACVRS